MTSQRKRFFSLNQIVGNLIKKHKLDEKGKKGLRTSIGHAFDTDWRGKLCQPISRSTNCTAAQYLSLLDKLRKEGYIFLSFGKKSKKDENEEEQYRDYDDLLSKFQKTANKYFALENEKVRIEELMEEYGEENIKLRKENEDLRKKVKQTKKPTVDDFINDPSGKFEEIKNRVLNRQRGGYDDGDEDGQKQLNSSQEDKKTNEVLEDELQEQREYIQQLKDEINRYIDTINTLKKKLRSDKPSNLEKSVKMELKGANSENSELKEELREAKKKHRETKMELSITLDKLTKIKERVIELKTENSILKVSSSEEKQNTDFRKLYTEEKVESKTLQQENRIIRNNMKKLEIDIARNSTILEETSKKLKKLRKDKVHIEDVLNEERYERGVAEGSLKKIKSTLVILKKNYTEQLKGFQDQHDKLQLNFVDQLSKSQKLTDKYRKEKDEAVKKFASELKKLRGGGEKQFSHVIDNMGDTMSKLTNSVKVSISNLSITFDEKRKKEIEEIEKRVLGEKERTKEEHRFNYTKIQKILKDTLHDLKNTKIENGRLGKANSQLEKQLEKINRELKEAKQIGEDCQAQRYQDQRNSQAEMKKLMKEMDDKRSEMEKKFNGSVKLYYDHNGKLQDSVLKLSSELEKMTKTCEIQNETLMSNFKNERMPSELNLKFMNLLRKLEKLRDEFTKMEKEKVEPAALSCNKISSIPPIIGPRNEVESDSKVNFTIQFTHLNKEKRKDLIDEGYANLLKDLEINLLSRTSKIPPIKFIITKDREINFSCFFPYVGDYVLQMRIRPTKDNFYLNFSHEMKFFASESKPFSNTSEVKFHRKSGSEASSSKIYNNKGGVFKMGGGGGGKNGSSDDLILIKDNVVFKGDPLYVSVILRTKKGEPCRKDKVFVVFRHQQGKLDEYQYIFKPSEWNEKIKGYRILKGLALPVCGVYSITVGFQGSGGESFNMIRKIHVVESRRIKIRIDGDMDQVKNFPMILSSQLSSNRILSDIYEPRAEMSSLPDLQIHLNGRSLTPLIDDDAVRGNMERLVKNTTTKSAVYCHLVPKMSAAEYKKFGKIRNQPHNDNFQSVVFFGQFILEAYEDFYFPMDGGNIVTGIPCYGDQMNQLLSLILKVNDEVVKK